MSFSRLLVPKPASHFHITGVLRLTKGFSSSPSSIEERKKFSQLKGTNLAKESGGIEASQFKKSTAKLPTFFQEAVELQEKLVQSWYNLKGIVSMVKDKMLCDTPIQKEKDTEMSDFAVNLTVLKVITRDDTEQTTRSVEHRSLPQPQAPVDSPSSKKCNPEPCLVSDRPSGEEFDAITSETIRMHGNPHNVVGQCVTNVQVGESLEHSVPSPTGDTVDSSESERTHYPSVESTSKMDASFVEAVQSTENTLQQGENSENSKTLRVEERLLRRFLFNKVDHSANYQEEENGSVYFACKLPSETLETVQCESADRLTFTGNESHQLANKATPSQTLNINSNVNGRPSNSDLSRKFQGLTELFNSKMNDNEATVMDSKLKISNLLSPSGVGNNLPEKSTQDVKEMMRDIKKLDQTTSWQQDTASCIAGDQVSNKISADFVQPWDKLPNSKANKRTTSLKGHHGGRPKNNIKEAWDSQSLQNPLTTFGGAISLNNGPQVDGTEDHYPPKLESKPEVSLPTEKEDKNQSNVACPAELPTENKVLLRFLQRKVQESDIRAAFGHCVPIWKIKELRSVKRSWFKDAFLYFKTRETLQKALNIKDLRVSNSNAFVQSLSPEDFSDRLSIPNIIGDSDIPIAFLKNPTRTVKITQLSSDISLRQLRKALTSCESEITSLFWGSSTSVAYVEFKQEAAKESALTRHSIDVLGKQLVVFRIDAPRTTILRIYCENAKSFLDVQGTCSLYGKVTDIKRRHGNHVDVHFAVSEWPYMLKILNSLNGLEVDGIRWVVKPAPAFPPAILRVLWSHPDGRRHVEAVLRNLLGQLHQPFDIANLTMNIASVCST